jgi:DAK2 domain fusion protein YloV
MGNTPQRNLEGRAASATGGEELSGATLRQAFHDAAFLLQRHIEALNAINVYPVPDGDTGTNMSLTMRAAIDGMDAVRETGAGAAAAGLARGALMGARGNSGVILSQVLRGLAEGLEGCPAAGGAALARAFQNAQEAAYGALSHPREGTILTAVREAAETVDREAPVSASAALGAAARAAFEAAERTPELLPVLKEAGVVDAGALGLAILLEGLRRSVASETLDIDLAPNVDLSGSWQSDAAALHRSEHGESGYCTEFLIAGNDLDVATVRSKLDGLGTSLLVVGQPDLLRVHIHTSQPDSALAYGRSLGELKQTKVDNLEAQIDSFAAPGDSTDSAKATISVVAVASGNGIEQAFRSLGVEAIVEGGQTMNPSAGEILEAVQACSADEVVVLPNNKNIVAAAQQAASESRKNVIVVPTPSVPQGIAAALSLNPELSLDENKHLMESSLSSVTSGEITRAVRSTTLDGKVVHAGDAIGLIDGELRVVASGVADAVCETVAAMMNDDASLLTLYVGRDTSEEDAAAVADALREEHGSLEVEMIQGGQPHYLYLISLE